MRVVVDVMSTDGLAEELAQIGAEYRLLNQDGPAGGNPEVEINGPEGGVQNWLAANGYDSPLFV